MGRELKRVPLDFKWQIGQIWKGYINPFRSQECKCCKGTGLNEATKKLEEEWYGTEYDWVYPNGPSGRRWNNAAWNNHITDVEVKALVEEGRLMDFTHTWTRENGWQKKDPEYIPTAEEVNEWNRSGGMGGHDAINRCICVEARAKHLGVYGLCEICNGEGVIYQSEEIKQLHKNWESFDPPDGEGYQLWETTSEGSPSSPVFKTLDELCAWCENNATTFGSKKTTKENWKKMLDDGLVSHQDGNIIFI